MPPAECASRSCVAVPRDSVRLVEGCERARPGHHARPTQTGTPRRARSPLVAGRSLSQVFPSRRGNAVLATGTSTTASRACAWTTLASCSAEYRRSAFAHPSSAPSAYATSYQRQMRPGFTTGGCRSTDRIPERVHLGSRWPATARVAGRDPQPAGRRAARRWRLRRSGRPSQLWW
jgi:hypothetical protein